MRSRDYDGPPCISDFDAEGIEILSGAGAAGADVGFYEVG